MESKQQHIIPIYTQRDIEGIKAACRLGRKVLDACVSAVKPGVTTDELDRICHEARVAGNDWVEHRVTPCDLGSATAARLATQRACGIAVEAERALACFSCR